MTTGGGNKRRDPWRQREKVSLLRKNPLFTAVFMAFVLFSLWWSLSTGPKEILNADVLLQQHKAAYFGPARKRENGGLDTDLDLALVIRQYEQGLGKDLDSSRNSNSNNNNNNDGNEIGVSYTAVQQPDDGEEELPSVCAVIGVYSNAADIELRNWHRKAYQQYMIVRGRSLLYRMKLVFFIADVSGIGDDNSNSTSNSWNDAKAEQLKKLKRLLHEENEKYGDILLSSQQESIPSELIDEWRYWMTVSPMSMSLKLDSIECSASYLIRSDLSFVLSYPDLVQTLEEAHTTNATLFGTIWHGLPVTTLDRMEKSHSYERFPSFAYGPFYGVEAKALQEALFHQPYSFIWNALPYTHPEAKFRLGQAEGRMLSLALHRQNETVGTMHVPGIHHSPPCTPKVFSSSEPSSSEICCPDGHNLVVQQASKMQGVTVESLNKAQSILQHCHSRQQAAPETTKSQSSWTSSSNHPESQPQQISPSMGIDLSQPGWEHTLCDSRCYDSSSVTRASVDKVESVRDAVRSDIPDVKIEQQCAESLYLGLHPNVQKDVSEGKYTSARDHYVQVDVYLPSDTSRPLETTMSKWDGT